MGRKRKNRNESPENGDFYVPVMDNEVMGASAEDGVTLENSLVINDGEQDIPVSFEYEAVEEAKPEPIIEETPVPVEEPVVEEIPQEPAEEPIEEPVVEEPVVVEEPAVEKEEIPVGPVILPKTKKGVYRLILNKNPSRLRIATVEKKLLKLGVNYNIIEEDGNVLWVSKNFPTKALAVVERKRLISNGVSSILEEI